MVYPIKDLAILEVWEVVQNNYMFVDGKGLIIDKWIVD